MKRRTAPEDRVARRPSPVFEAVAVEDAAGPPAVAVAPSDILHGSIDRALLRLAGPAILAKGLHAALGLVDIFWVGRLGAAPTAAVTTSFFASWVLASATDLTALGILAHVARATGAGDRTRAGHASAQGLLLGAAVGAVLAVLAWLGAPALFRTLGAAPEVVIPGIDYLRIFYLAAPLTFTVINCEFLMRAAGDTRTPLAVAGLMVLVNAVLDPLLIYGVGPFPRMEVRGAAWATLLAQAMACAAFAVIAARRHPRFPLVRRSLVRVDAELCRSLLRIGAPGFAVGTLFSCIYLFMSSVAARLGTAALAVVGLANRAESMTYLVCQGFGAATATLVGQNLGARRPDRAARAAWRSTFWMMLYASATGALLWFCPRWILGLFTTDAGVLDAGEPYLRVLGIAQPCMALEIVLENAFAGAGDNVPPMVISLPLNLVRIPLILWIAERQGAGLMGIVWVVTLTAMLRGVLAAAWFRRGAWARREL